MPRLHLCIANKILCSGVSAVQSKWLPYTHINETLMDKRLTSTVNMRASQDFFCQYWALTGIANPNSAHILTVVLKYWLFFRLDNIGLMSGISNVENYSSLSFSWCPCVVPYTHNVCFSAAGYQHVPSWVWVAAGIFNFLAYTLGEFWPLQLHVACFYFYCTFFFPSYSWEVEKLTGKCSAPRKLKGPYSVFVLDVYFIEWGTQTPVFLFLLQLDCLYALMLHLIALHFHFFRSISNWNHKSYQTICNLNQIKLHLSV